MSTAHGKDSVDCHSDVVECLSVVVDCLSDVVDCLSVVSPASSSQMSLFIFSIS